MLDHAQNGSPRTHPQACRSGRQQQSAGAPGSRGTIQRDLQHPVAFLAESTGAMASELPMMHLWGCFQPASQTAPPLTQSLPGLLQPGGVL